ncbi:MAG TPA: class I SAM-dependent methyltransferase, partial [Mycobacteriales bacterium]|nr:class I SAM-dependent methyltransferase [Mycobacteriales bacterium]
MTAGTLDSRGNAVARVVFKGLPARYDQLAYLLSFGQDRRWRRATVDHVVAAAPRHVLDVATGPAGVALAIARRSPAAIVGVDLNLPMLARGQRNVREAHRDAQV